MPKNSDSKEIVSIPIGYPTSLVYLDESGSRASADRFFVVGAIKVRNHGALMRAVADVRDRNAFRGEFKFSQITRGALVPFYDLVDQLENSDAMIAACVVDRSSHDVFRGFKPSWEVHAQVASQLLVGCINRREFVSVLMDAITTPSGVSLEENVRRTVNRRLKSTRVVTAASLDSRCSDGLQLADLVASAIAFDRRLAAGDSGNPGSHKAKVAARLKAALGVTSFADGRTGRVNITTYRGSPRKPKLEVVRSSSRAV